jgi:ATP-dependent helicase HrpB
LHYLTTGKIVITAIRLTLDLALGYFIEKKEFLLGIFCELVIHFPVPGEIDRLSPHGRLNDDILLAGTTQQGKNHQDGREQFILNQNIRISAKEPKYTEPMTEKLPIQDVLSDLVAALQDHHEAVLQAPPGAGKTTLVPLEFLKTSLFVDSKVLLLEPRRLAARSAAARMADLLGEAPGETVGYRMRQDTRISAQTRIEVVTEGVLLKLLHADPALTDYGLVIFDEFHERNLDADLGLALTLKSRELFRDSPLKILIMSATLETDRLSRFLGDAPLIRSEGKQFPVEVHYRGAYQPRDKLVPRLAATLRSVLTEHREASILVFLPGEGEIRQLETLLREQQHSGLEICPLFGNLDLNTQRRAIAPVPAPRRKVVLATNIAESSLTIEGVTVVVDSGLERRARFDPNTAMSRLHTSRISLASATQRTGRAGRLAPGFCYRLWSEEQQGQMLETTPAEITEADLGHLALQILGWGISAPNELSWLDPPPTAHWQQALDLLVSFRAVAIKAESYLLSEHGEQMAALALEPRIAHMLIWSKMLDVEKVGLALAALWSERDPFQRDSRVGINPGTRVEILLQEISCPAPQKNWLNRCLRHIKQMSEQLHSISVTHHDSDLDREQAVACLVALAFPDRIARKRHSGGYQLANGRSAVLPENTRMTAKWLAIAEVSGTTGASDTVRSALPLPAQLFQSHLSGLVSSRRVVDWNKQKARFVAERQRTIGQLVLDREPLPEISPEERINTICEYIRREGLTLFKRHPEFLKLQARCALLYQFQPASELDLSDDTLLTTLEEWLGPYLTQVVKLDSINKIDISKICLDRLSFEQRRGLDKLVPETYVVPSGSVYKIDYLQSPPVLAVKLQEMFGAEQTPTIANGQVDLVVHLLSPAGRPLQITQDLAGFWRSSYQAVRKEMRGRYPKHPWPEDPTQAIATRHTKKRGP